MNINTVNTLVYKPCGFSVTDYHAETESLQYKACSFALNNLRVKFRKSKITPTKVGQFVTTWKRNEKGITVPFDDTDDFDLLVIESVLDEKLGHFVFTKQALAANKIIASTHTKGKCGIRVYPTWDKPENKQAIQTQQQQSACFYNFRLASEISRFKEMIEGMLEPKLNR